MSFSKTYKKHSKNIEKYFPITIFVIITILILISLFSNNNNVKEGLEKKKEEKAKSTWITVALIIVGVVVLLIIIYIIYLSFKDTPLISTGKQSNMGRGREQFPGDSVVQGYYPNGSELLQNDGYTKLKQSGGRKKK